MKYGFIQLTLIVGTCSVFSAFAESERERSAPVFEASFESVERADVHKSGDSFAVRHYALEFEWLVLLLEYHHLRYDWRMRTDERDPWGSLHRLKPGLQYLHRFDERWGAWPKLIAIAGYEDSPKSVSWTWNPQLIGFYRATPRATLFFGAGSLYHTVDPVYYPVLGIAVSEEGGHGFSGALGFPETMARYRFSEQWAVKADFEWNIRFYSLERANPITPGGYLRLEDRVPGVHLEYTPVSGLTLRPGVRWHLGRSVTLYDDREREIESSRVDGAWAGMFEVAYRF